MIVIAVSNLLFLAVTVVVVVKGWNDIAELRRRLRRRTRPHRLNGSSDNSQTNPPV